MPSISGMFEVGDHDVGRPLTDELERRLAVLGDVDLVALLPEELLERGQRALASSSTTRMRM